MIGGIIGDIVGSRFEFSPKKTKDFDLFVGDGYNPDAFFVVRNDISHFTDDSVMAIAVCRALLECDGNYDFLSESTMKHMTELAMAYPWAGYGYKFKEWLFSKNKHPYNSCGNGAAMRIGAVAYFAKDLTELKELVYKVTAISHDHPEGIKGAEATAVCVWLALQGKNKDEIREYVEQNYYNLDFDYSELIETYSTDLTCQGSVPQSIYSFLISNSYEDTIRTAISLGGDTDTMACIAGYIAGAFFGVPEKIEKRMFDFLPDDITKTVLDFKKYVKNKS